MTVTTTRLRQTVVAEAVERALGECVFLFVYEYKDMFDHTIWAVLTKGKQRPEDSRLLCTINHLGQVDWKIDELVQKPIATSSLPQLSGITLPIEAVQFNNVTITIPATDPTAAYGTLCQVLSTFEYTTDTFQTNGAAGELSDPQSTTILFDLN